ncbi:MAG: hypothetical protein DCC67_05765 [Planctomycetota bacterium]|nr:MAG: hypothetical protein DCC67_05765 [Planctomycetota bacterium]
MLFAAAPQQVAAQAPPPAAAGAAEPTAEVPSSGDASLAQSEAQLKQRYDRLELLASRLGELSAATQPRRAALLRELISQSRGRDVAGQFDRVIEAMEQESYSTALERQNALEADLQKLLDLLLQEDRDRQIESQRKRISRYLQDLNRLIRLQRGVKARTDAGDDAARLAEDQQRVGQRTKQLGDEIEENENSPAPARSPDAGQETKPSPGGDPSSSPPEPMPGEPDGAETKPQPGSPGQPQPQSPSPEANPGSPAGEPSDQQTPQPGPPQSPPNQPPQTTPIERAAERLRQAQLRMEQAKQRLEQAQRDGAADEQTKAVEQLEQAKAELERILRQLREEELERMLATLEARFRKMLDAQIEVYDETKKLDAAANKAPAHELEIAGSRLSRQEATIVREADRALVLLREDGTSVAFPEAIEQARDDMQAIAERLQNAKFEMITQGLEEDVIEALEETLASLQKALQDLRDQQARQGQPGGGQPGQQPLVDKLAELRMIRALQKRVNDRTVQYGAMIDGEQAFQADLLEALDELALRQQRIFQATRDLDRNEE